MILSVDVVRLELVFETETETTTRVWHKPDTMRSKYGFAYMQVVRNRKSNVNVWL